MASTSAEAEALSVPGRGGECTYYTIVSVKKALFTARRSYASAVLGVVILSVGPSVTRVLCNKTKQCTAYILVPHERQSLLVF